MWIKTVDALTYQETLNLIEKFMIESRIREYCTEICKGDCCATCYKSEEACRFHEGRRLICSAFICSDLIAKLCKETRRTLCYIHSVIEEQYTSYQTLTQTAGNCYFRSPDKIFLEIVRFPHCLKEKIKSINTKEIKKVINKLIKEKRKVQQKRRKHGISN